jgi:hypothetical protein
MLLNMTATYPGWWMATISTVPVHVMLPAVALQDIATHVSAAANFLILIFTRVLVLMG